MAYCLECGDGDCISKCKRLRAEIAAKDARITELRGLLAYATDTDAYRRIRARAERAEARITEFEARLQRQYAILLEHKSRAERAEAELDISREAHRMVQSALLSQAAETERVEAERDALREALQKIEQETIDHVAVRIARAALNPSPAGREG